MSATNAPKRRNISWSKSTDELAERLAIDKEMAVSQLLEQLVLDEAKHGRIKSGQKSTLIDTIRDVATTVFENMSNKTEKLADAFESRGKAKIEKARKKK